MSNNISKYSKYDNEKSDNKELEKVNKSVETNNTTKRVNDDEIKKIYEKWEQRLENEDKFEEREMQKVRARRNRKSNTFQLVSGIALIIMSTLGLFQLLTNSEAQLQSPKLILTMYIVFGVIGIIVTLISVLKKKRIDEDYREQGK